MFIDNDWWGHKHVLAKYCGVKSQPIFGSLQHGVETLQNEENWKLSPNKYLKNIKFFCYSNYFYMKCKNNNISSVEAIGSPFLYLDRITPKIIKKKGTIVFPAHNSINSKKKILLIIFLVKKDHLIIWGLLKMLRNIIAHLT